MIYLYGASGHAKVIIEILEQQGIVISGLVDANPNVKILMGYPVYISLAAAPSFANQAEIIITIGNNIIRKKLAESIKSKFGAAVHASANISSNCFINNGSVIMAGVAVNSGTKIGKHCILNTNCSIDHDCILEDYVHISPNAALAGNIKVGEGTHIGIGACIIQGVSIGSWVTIGAGTVVIRDVPDYAVVVGNPGKIIKYNLIDNL